MSMNSTILIFNATTPTEGKWKTGNGRPPTFDASVAGTGAVSAEVAIEVRNTPEGPPALLGTITLSGTNVAADGFGYPAQFSEYRARVVSVSAGASVTAALGG